MKCEVIRDILPLYLEQLTGKETNDLVEEHLQHCKACQEAYEQMTNEELDEVLMDDQGSMKDQNKQNHIAVLRAMKKVSWRRVAIMVVESVTILILTVLLGGLIWAQFHPESDLPNIENYRMKQTAKKATECLVLGDIKGFMAGVANAYHISEGVFIDSQIYEMAVEKMQNLYDENKKELKSSIKEINDGWISIDGEKKSWYCVDVFLENGVTLNYTFIGTDSYQVDIFTQDGSVLEAVITEMNDILGYALNQQESWIDTRLEELFYQERDGQNEKNQPEVFYRTHVWNVFSKDCYQINHTAEPTRTTTELGKRMFRFARENTFLGYSVEKNGIDPDTLKERRTMIWQVRDSEGQEGIFMKEFYYGPAGYEAVDVKGKIYGNLNEACKQGLNGLFENLT